MAEENPEAKPQSWATVGSRGAGLPLTAVGAEGIPVYLLMLCPTCWTCLSSCLELPCGKNMTVPNLIKSQLIV
jgi:hypothetical protein